MNAFSILSLLLVAVYAEHAAEFRVRRINQNLERRMNDDFFLTHSDDGRSKTLDPFILEMFETPSQIQPEALPVLRMAMNKFLLAEFNAIYASDDNELESVGSEILLLESTTKNGRRSLQETGTSTEMEVTLTFDNEPSPPTAELEEEIRVIMEDLSYFVTNLTSFKIEDWKDVTEAYRLEITSSPTQSPGSADGIKEPDINPDGSDSERNRNGVVNAVVPTTLVAATMIAMIAFLFVQRRANTTAETPKGEDAMFVDVENDLYSMDRSLESSRSPIGLGFSEYSLSADPSLKDDSVFSGLDFSPTNGANVKPTKSMVSGVTNASATTIRASNIPKNQRTRQTSYSVVGGSLFAFDEEGEAEEERTFDDRMAPPHLTHSDISDDSTQDSSPTGGAQVDESGTSSEVLADLEKWREKISSARDATESAPDVTMKQSSGSNNLSYNPFTCGPPVTNKDEAKTTSADLGVQHPVTPRMGGIFACQPLLFGNSMETPMTNNTSRATAPGSNMSKSSSLWGEKFDTPGSVGSMSGRATSILGGVYSPDGVVLTKGNRPRARSLDTRDQVGKSKRQHESKSAPSTPERSRSSPKKWLPSARVMSMSPPGADDYVENLSHPSTPGDEFDQSMPYPEGNEDSYGYYSSSRGQQEDPPASGRRHAGNTGADGTSFYQMNAMQPLDWSYKSADGNSVGDSSLSDNEGLPMPRQFLFSGKKSGRGRLSNSSREPKTPMSEMSAKTSESSQASASRQLINDLVWLEKKIADVRHGSMSKDPPAIDTVDSLSYVSTDNEGFVSASSTHESEQDPTVSTGRNESIMSSIVCRDCYAPPGKLHIVIHSTKDGPAVHTVKQGSSLEGHIFPGDLIISVDNVDTRSFTAEQVMKMMASKSSQERKITVLHFEEED